MSKLVITRRMGERVFVDGEDIKVEIVGIKGNQVRLAIEAPKEISIHREEIYKKIKAEQEGRVFTRAYHSPGIDSQLKQALVKVFNQQGNYSAIN